MPAGFAEEVWILCVCVCVRRVEAGRRGFDGNGNGVHMESGERMF